MRDEQRSEQTDATTPVNTKLGQFAAAVAHELSTPLTVIGGAAKLALSDPAPADDEHRKLLETIARQTDVAGMMLSRLRAAADLDAEPISLDRCRLDLAMLAREVVEDLREVVLKDHPVHVGVEAPAPVVGDPTAIREILFNLLANAAKYSEPGALIDVRTDVRGDHARLTVRDHGRGVTPDDTERIFDKFAKQPGEAPGLGLGLFLSRRLAHAHGGELSVHPARDVGSEFRLTLPRAA